LNEGLTFGRRGEKDWEKQQEEVHDRTVAKAKSIHLV
jgi:hypothetical protein